MQDPCDFSQGAQESARLHREGLRSSVNQEKESMKAILINAQTRSIEPVEISAREDIVRLVGYDTLESDAIGSAGDRLFFDEECFLRGTSGRFQIDTVVPVSGIGVIVGTAADGSTLCDAATDLDDLRNRIKYL
jgi:hypothetical protein